MTGFEPRTSGIGSDRSTNWATTTSLKQILLPTEQSQHYNNKTREYLLTYFIRGVWLGSWPPVLLLLIQPNK